MDKKESEQIATEVKGDTTKTVAVEGNASSNNNATATLKVRVY